MHFILSGYYISKPEVASSTSRTSSSPSTTKDVLNFVQNYLQNSLPFNIPLLAHEPLIEQVPVVYTNTFTPLSSSKKTQTISTKTVTLSSSSSVLHSSSPTIYRCGIILNEPTIIQYNGHKVVRVSLCNLLLNFPPQRLQSWLIIMMNYCAYSSLRQVLINDTLINTTLNKDPVNETNDEYNKDYTLLVQESQRNNHYLSIFHNKLDLWEKQYLGCLTLLN